MRIVRYSQRTKIPINLVFNKSTFKWKVIKILLIGISLKKILKYLLKLGLGQTKPWMRLINLVEKLFTRQNMLCDN